MPSTVHACSYVLGRYVLLYFYLQEQSCKIKTSENKDWNVCDEEEEEKEEGRMERARLLLLLDNSNQTILIFAFTVFLTVVKQIIMPAIGINRVPPFVQIFKAA